MGGTTRGRGVPDDHTRLRPDRTTLLTIDVQNDFTLAGAPLEVSGTRQAVPAMRQVVAAFRDHDLPIVHVVRLYLPDGSNADLSRRGAIREGAPVAAPGSPGAELVTELRPSREATLDAELLLEGRLQPVGEREWIMYKPRWGAFHDTPLLAHLRDQDVDSVVVCGCNFPNCPRTTVYEASERDLRVGLVTDATSGLYPRALDELEGIGVTLLDASECVALLGDARPAG